MADSIVTFYEPPVVEVVASVRFDPMRPENDLSIGQVWNELWAADYPRFEIQPPYSVSPETFDSTVGQPRGFDFQLVSGPPPVRAWMGSEDGQHLLQLQRDWFAVNWRRGGGYEYDRWPKRLATFQEQWFLLRDWLITRHESAAARQFEVTYINHVRVAQGVWASHSDIGEVFPGLALPTSASVQLEGTSLNASFIVAEEGDLPPARLHVGVTPAYVQSETAFEPEPVFVLELTVRGAPPINGSFERFGNRGRAAIVNTFIELTSPAMHKVWEKQ